MKARPVIIDTGPLVAFLNKNDAYHQWTLAQFGALKPPLLTCEAVISETCFLLKNYEGGIDNVLAFLSRQLLTIPFRLEDELSALATLLDKYKDLPMSLADACLVRMAEKTTDGVVLTLDSDFKTYRKHKRQVVPTITPGDV